MRDDLQNYISSFIGRMSDLIGEKVSIKAYEDNWSRRRSRPFFEIELEKDETFDLEIPFFAEGKCSNCEEEYEEEGTVEVQLEVEAMGTMPLFLQYLRYNFNQIKSGKRKFHSTWDMLDQLHAIELELEAALEEVRYAKEQTAHLRQLSTLNEWFPTNSEVATITAKPFLDEERIKLLYERL